MYGFVFIYPLDHPLSAGVLGIHDFHRKVALPRTEAGNIILRTVRSWVLPPCVQGAHSGYAATLVPVAWYTRARYIYRINQLYLNYMSVIFCTSESQLSYNRHLCKIKTGLL